MLNTSTCWSPTMSRRQARALDRIPTGSSCLAPTARTEEVPLLPKRGSQTGFSTGSWHCRPVVGRRKTRAVPSVRSTRGSIPSHRLRPSPRNRSVGDGRGQRSALKEFLPLSDEYIKAGMWQEAAAVLEDGLKIYPGFVTAMAALGRSTTSLAKQQKAKAILEDVVKTAPRQSRAHRIPIRLYQSGGTDRTRANSCTAILNANPFDDEALSLKQAITGTPAEAPPTKRERKRPEADAKVEKLQTASPVMAGSNSVPTTGPAAIHHQPRR